jgi:hypothetical protein
MTTRNDEHRERELESLYREAGDAEPSDGLDRIIRARADQAAERTRRRRFAPWVGGLTTASVAIIAVTLGFLQKPNGASEHRVPAEAQTPALESAEPAGRSPDRTALQKSETAPAGAPQQGAALRERRSVRDTEAVEIAPSADFAGDRAAPANDADEALPPLEPSAASNDIEAMLARIRALLESGETERARAWAERLVETHPDYKLPEELRSRLTPEAPDGER